VLIYMRLSKVDSCYHEEKLTTFSLALSPCYVIDCRCACRTYVFMNQYGSRSKTPQKSGKAYLFLFSMCRYCFLPTLFPSRKLFSSRLCSYSTLVVPPTQLRSPLATRASIASQFEGVVLTFLRISPLYYPHRHVDRCQFTAFFTWRQWPPLLIHGRWCVHSSILFSLSLS